MVAYTVCSTLQDSDAAPAASEFNEEQMKTKVQDNVNIECNFTTWNKSMLQNC